MQVMRRSRRAFTGPLPPSALDGPGNPGATARRGTGSGCTLRDASWMSPSHSMEVGFHGTATSAHAAYAPSFGAATRPLTTGRSPYREVVEEVALAGGTARRAVG